MKKTSKAMLVAMLLLYATNSMARPYTTIGLTQCTKWLDDRDKLRESKLYGIPARTNLGWVVGFLSALNAIESNKKDVLANVDADTVADWVDDYCLKNPTHSAADAALELYNKLLKI
jgi:hypothetical protein